MSKVDGQIYSLKNVPDDFYDHMYDRLDWLGPIFFEFYSGKEILDTFTIDDLMQRASFQSSGLHRSIELRFNGISRDHMIDTKEEYEILEEVLSDIYLERARELIDMFNREETWLKRDEKFAQDFMALIDVYKRNVSADGTVYRSENIKELERIISGIDLSSLRKQEVIDLWRDVEYGKYENQKSPFITGLLKEVYQLRQGANVEVVDFRDWEKAVIAIFHTHPEAVDFGFFTMVMNDMQHSRRRLIEDYILFGEIPEDVEENLYFDPEANRANIVDVMFEKYPERMLSKPWNDGDQQSPPMAVLLGMGHPKALQIFMDFLENDPESPYVGLLADFAMKQLEEMSMAGSDYYGDFLRNLMTEDEEFKRVPLALRGEFEEFREKASRIVRGHFYTDAPFSGVISAIFTDGFKALDVHDQMIEEWREADRAMGRDFKPPTYANLASLIGSDFVKHGNYYVVLWQLLRLVRRGHGEALTRSFELAERNDNVGIAAMRRLASLLKTHLSRPSSDGGWGLSQRYEDEIKKYPLTDEISGRLLDFFKTGISPYRISQTMNDLWKKGDKREVEMALLDLRQFLITASDVEFENVFQLFVANMRGGMETMPEYSAYAFREIDKYRLYGDRPPGYLIEMVLTASSGDFIAYDYIKEGLSKFRYEINPALKEYNPQHFMRYVDAMFEIAKGCPRYAIDATENLISTYKEIEKGSDSTAAWLGSRLRDMDVAMVASYIMENESNVMQILYDLASLGNESAFRRLVQAFEAGHVAAKDQLKKLLIEDGAYAGDILNCIGRILFDDDMAHLHGAAEEILFAAVDADIHEAWRMLCELATANIGVDYKYATRLLSARSAGNYDAQLSAVRDFDRSLSDYIYSLDIEYDGVDRERGLVGGLAGNFESWEAWHALEWFADEQKMLYEGMKQPDTGPDGMDADRKEINDDAGGSPSDVTYVEKADGGVTEAYKVYHKTNMNGYYDAAIDDSQPPEVRKAGIDRITESAQPNAVAVEMLSGIAAEFEIDMAISNYALEALVQLAMQDDPPNEDARAELSILIEDFERIAINPQDYIDAARMAVLCLYKIVMMSDGENTEAVESLENIAWSMSQVRADAEGFLKLIGFQFKGL